MVYSFDDFYLSPLKLIAGEIQGAYQIKVTTTALALLLSSRHAELAKINVQGYLVQVLVLLKLCDFMHLFIF